MQDITETGKFLETTFRAAAGEKTSFGRGYSRGLLDSLCVWTRTKTKNEVVKQARENNHDPVLHGPSALACDYREGYLAARWFILTVLED